MSVAVKMSEKLKLKTNSSVVTSKQMFIIKMYKLTKLMSVAELKKKSSGV